MRLSQNFYAIAANTIPVLLIALAVERFRIDSDDADRAQFRTGLMALAALMVAECVTVGVLAAERSNETTDMVLMSALGLGLCFLAAAYTNVLFVAFPRYRQRANRGRLSDVGLVAISIGAPVVFLIWWLWNQQSGS